MASDGKQLEGIVAYVEKTLLPQGFEVKTNERVFNDEGIQIAEFDIEIRGKVGTTKMAWLIECRDRPTDGPAPGSWIEQLVGRRTRFGFNKVTAVSTTRFTTGAVDFAHKEGIELREVSELSADAFSDWLQLQQITHQVRFHRLDNALIIVSGAETEERKTALLKVLSNAASNALFLKSSKTGAVVSVAAAFEGAVSENAFLFDGLVPNGPAQPIRLRAQYNNDEDHFLIETETGPVRPVAIEFTGELSIQEYISPLAATSEYRQAASGETISQYASFEPQSIQGMEFSVEMHRMSETGETHVVLRRVSDNVKIRRQRKDKQKINAKDKGQPLTWVKNEEMRHTKK